jgi:predicted RNA-binding Zn-ribbon protein involved in translation (DUF1610 family)
MAMPESTGFAIDGQLQLICPECGYDLRSINSQRCPECGLAIDRATMSVSHLPWSHRQSIGRVRAYWRTNVLVILRPKRLAEEIARPVSFFACRNGRGRKVRWQNRLISLMSGGDDLISSFACRPAPSPS